jgi:hypothetical protein
MNNAEEDNVNGRVGGEDNGGEAEAEEAADELRGDGGNDDDSQVSDDDDGSLHSESTTDTDEPDDDVIPSEDEGEDGDGLGEESVEYTAEFISDRLPHICSIYDSLIAAIRGYTKSDVRRVARIVSERCKKPVEVLTIDLSGYRHDFKVAKRVTKILGGLDLRELKEVELEFDGSQDDIHPLKAAVVDHYISFLLRSVTSVTHLTRITVPILGSNEELWSEFLTRFKKSIVRLGIGAHWRGTGSGSRLNSNSIVRRLGQVPDLRHLMLHLSSRDAEPFVSVLFQGISHLQALQSLQIHISHCRDRRADTAAAVTGVDGVITLSRSLKRLSITRSPNALADESFDCCQVMESLLHSESVDWLRLDGLGLQATRLNPQDTTSNESIETIVLMNCTIEAPGWSLLQRFRGVKSIELTGVKSDLGYHASWSELFLVLPRLASFSDHSSGRMFGNQAGYLRQNCREHTLARVATRIASAPSPSLAKLSLETTAGVQGFCTRLPSLATLVRNSKGSLSLYHQDENGPTACNANLGFISSGVEQATSLTKFDLTCVRSSLTSPSVIAFLRALQASRSVDTFTGEFGVVVHWGEDPHCLDGALFDLFSLNKTLKCFGLRVKMFISDSSRQSLLAKCNETILSAVVRGLKHNQTLKELTYVSDSWLKNVTPSLLDALQHNVTLEGIRNDLGWRPRTIPEEVEWFLALNRYKRRCLVKASEVPIGCWSAVFERIVKDDRCDVLYHFLKRSLPLLRSRRGILRPVPPPIEEIN